MNAKKEFFIIQAHSLFQMKNKLNEQFEYFKDITVTTKEEFKINDKETLYTYLCKGV